MIPSEQLKKYSSYYHLLFEEEDEEAREEGRREGRQQTIANFFRKLVARRFPELELNSEIEAVEDIEQLKELALDLQNISNAKTLRRKLKALRATVN